MAGDPPLRRTPSAADCGTGLMEPTCGIFAMKNGAKTNSEAVTDRLQDNTARIKAVSRRRSGQRGRAGRTTVGGRYPETLNPQGRQPHQWLPPACRLPVVFRRNAFREEEKRTNCIGNLRSPAQSQDK
jgi:hypothetical protein